MDAVSTDLPVQQPKRGNRVLVGVLVLVLAVALFGVAFVYAGGIDIVQGILSGSPAVPGGSTPTPGSASSSSTPSGTTLTGPDLETAKLAYAEQIQSQANIDRLADGDIASFVVTKVDVKPTVAIVTITARFKDKTSAPGALRFIKSNGTWYFTSISGLRTATTGGMADTVGSGPSAAATLTGDEALAAVGVKQPDRDILATMVEQQKANQPVVRDLLAGEYQDYLFGKPVPGPSTFTVPVTMSSEKESPSKASIVLVAKTVEGKDRLFIASFKRQ